MTKQEWKKFYSVRTISKKDGSFRAIATCMKCGMSSCTGHDEDSAIRNLATGNRWTLWEGAQK